MATRNELFDYYRAMSNEDLIRNGWTYANPAIVLAILAERADDILAPTSTSVAHEEGGLPRIPFTPDLSDKPLGEEFQGFLQSGWDFKDPMGNMRAAPEDVREFLSSPERQAKRPRDLIKMELNFLRVVRKAYSSAFWRRGR